MNTRWLGKSWNYCAETDSTNDWAKREAGKGASHGSVYLADSQTKGKGRRGRNWSNPRGSGLAMSLLLKPDIDAEKAPMLTLVMGLSAAQAVERLTGMRADIKWPNDLVMNRKKLCGILTEMSVGMSGIKYVVIGCGINLNMEEFPEEIRETATSLFLECGKKISRDVAAEAVLECFEENYQTFVKTCDLSELCEAYSARLINRNVQVKVLERGREFTGISRGIDASGQLLVEKEDGVQERIFAGEVSVRGIYGYV